MAGHAKKIYENLIFLNIGTSILTPCNMPNSDISTSLENCKIVNWRYIKSELNENKKVGQKSSSPMTLGLNG